MPRVRLLNDWTKALLGLLSPVVLVLINLLGELVLLAIDLGALLRRQLAAIEGALGIDFLVDGRFLLLQMTSFAGRQLAARDALTNAVLLVFRSLADFALWIGVLHRGIVLVLVNLLGKLVLLLLQSSAVRLGEMAVIHGLHITLFLVQFGLLLLQVRGLSGRQLATVDAIGDAILLIFFRC
jgi:hypothetical protein